MDAGRSIASGTADELKAHVGGEHIELVVHDRASMSAARDVLARHGDGPSRADEHTRRLSVPVRGGAQRLVEVVRDLDESAIAIDDIGLRRPTLDDVFLARRVGSGVLRPAYHGLR